MRLSETLCAYYTWSICQWFELPESPDEWFQEDSNGRGRSKNNINYDLIHFKCTKYTHQVVVYAIHTLFVREFVERRVTFYPKGFQGDMQCEENEQRYRR